MVSARGQLGQRLIRGIDLRQTGSGLVGPVQDAGHSGAGVGVLADQCVELGAAGLRRWPAAPGRRRSSPAYDPSSAPEIVDGDDHLVELIGQRAQGRIGAGRMVEAAAGQGEPGPDVDRVGRWIIRVAEQCVVRFARG